MSLSDFWDYLRKKEVNFSNTDILKLRIVFDLQYYT